MKLNFAPRLDNVHASAIRELFKLLGKPGIISFAGGFPDSEMFDVEGLREASDRALGLEPSAALQYGATEGYAPLREQLSIFMKGKGVRVDASDLIVTTGSQQALDLIGKTMIGPGDKVIVEGPTFLAAIQCFRLYGAEVISAPIDGCGIKTDELEELIVRHKPKLIYLIPTFGNPSGATLSLDRRIRILELARQYDCLIVEDDPYGDLHFNHPPPLSIMALSEQFDGARGLVAYCGSLSKILSPGLRIGWLIAPPELLAKATLCKQFSDAHTSTFAQATAAQYLAGGRMPECLDNARRVYGQRALAMSAALDQVLGKSLSYTMPEGGLFFWARLTGEAGRSTDASGLAKEALSHSVAFVPGAPFFAGDPDSSALRLSFATANTEKIEEGVHRIGKALLAIE